MNSCLGTRQISTTLITLFFQPTSCGFQTSRYTTGNAFKTSMSMY